VSHSDSEKLPCDFEAELPLLLYQGELDREERERLKSHIATCARCSDALMQLESTAIALDGAMSVPKPSDEQWAKLKANVLSRVAAPATPADAPPPDEACESIEEDLLVLNELGVDRKRQVLKHLDGCSSCRDTRSAFGSIGIVLNRQPLEWPSIERWDSLKDTIAATIDGEVKQEVKQKESARLPKQVPAMTVRRLQWGTFARAAAGVVLLIGVTVTISALRGPSAEDVRVLYREAQGGGTLAVVAHKYELVVKNGIDRPECRGEVDDAQLQLLAIHHFERAMNQPTQELKLVDLKDCIVRYPSAQVTQLALTKYNELMPISPNSPYPGPQRRSGFEEPGGPRFNVDIHWIQRYTESLESQYVAIKDLDDQASVAKKADLRVPLVAGYMQIASSSESQDRAKALECYKKALSYAEPGSPNWNDAKKNVDRLGGK
jgi:anti-sigma factor RsiW